MRRRSAASAASSSAAGAEEALVEVAAPAGEQRLLAGLLDPLDQRPAARGRCASRIIARMTIRSRAPGDEAERPGAIELEHVERQAGEIGEAGIARCRNRRARCVTPGGAQLAQPCGDRIVADEQRMLGDLDRQPRRVEPDPRHLVEQPVVMPFARNFGRQQVERQAETLERPCPARRRAQRLALDQLRQAPRRGPAAARAAEQDRGVGLERERASASAPTTAPERSAIHGW